MGRPAGSTVRNELDSHIKIKQRKALCYDCGSLYIGEKEVVICRGCKRELQTADTGAVKIVATGQWLLYLDKTQVSNCSIVGEVPGDGSR